MTQFTNELFQGLEAHWGTITIVVAALASHVDKAYLFLCKEGGINGIKNNVFNGATPSVKQVTQTSTQTIEENKTNEKVNPITPAVTVP